ncbi:hypothetical protein [Janthinobacterium lividum]|uniref:hypothetical protein n=1 Tax=Janthinobacterium lividum TaxID=29581 RepID=UPI000874E4BD|nr:hypothetical protein [Janthinobacterium lividum]MCC7716718.1 hypothetical protein [Janthinobacterium lividum]OEZ54274.1 hypothetical protein JANLI_39360 [Janthinobacterium lividum]WQE31787.1 hypothetical protein U0004_29680 [Janthinobacterium lividum]STS86054.1 Uncharacterised protein [Janthinobacterium lividum]
MIDAYHVYLNASEVMLRRQTGWGRWRRVEEIARWQWDAGTPASLNFDALKLRKRRYATLYVHVGSALGKFMMLRLPSELQGEQEERAAAEAQMQHQLGLNAGQWEFTLDHLPTRGKIVACALRADIGARLRQLANEHSLRLLSVRPYVAGVWNAMQLLRGPATLNGGRAVMMVERDAFTIVIEKEGKMDAMSTMIHRCETEVINREIRRMAYSLGEDAQRHVYLAVAGELLPLAQLHADKVVRHEDFLQPNLYADFRDLLFHPPVQGMP